MNKHYPQSIVSKILQITLETQNLAYLEISPSGELLNQGGKLEELNFSFWNTGDNILNDALFLSGLVPMQEEYEYLPSLQVSDRSVLDVHLFKEKNSYWIILVDKTEDLEWQQKARQNGNELRLLQQKLRLKENMPLNENSVIDFEFFEALNMMALCQNEDNSFRILKPVSKRFFSIYPESFENQESLLPQHKFTFIENFLIDAENIWNKIESKSREFSGPWIEQDTHGKDVTLEAMALNWDGHKLLFIEIQDEHYLQHQQFLQKGRENVLHTKELEKQIRKRTKDIRVREEEIALRLVCAANTREDGETGSHILRLGIYSELLAKNLGWSLEDCDRIRIAAPMHDIGKIGIPDHILKKPAKLTDEEFEVMKSHPVIGEKILANSKSKLVQMAQKIALSHHEKWDGSGYPQGLSGSNIPLSARIVTIVDVFDALIHKRIYKKSLSVEGAIQIMAEGRGKHFDPTLFDLFLELKNEMEQIAKDFVEPID